MRLYPTAPSKHERPLAEFGRAHPPRTPNTRICRKPGGGRPAAWLGRQHQAAITATRHWRKQYPKSDRPMMPCARGLPAEDDASTRAGHGLRGAASGVPAGEFAAARCGRPATAATWLRTTRSPPPRGRSCWQPTPTRGHASSGVVLAGQGGAETRRRHGSPHLLAARPGCRPRGLLRPCGRVTT